MRPAERMPEPASRFEPRKHSIPARFAKLKEARDFAVDAAAAFGLDNEGRYRVRLAMSEAVTNAIQHGSSSPRDPIRLAALEEGGALAFYVEDTGRFVPRVVRRDALAERGRGLHFIRLLMDEMEVRPGGGGTQLRFAKRK